MPPVAEQLGVVRGDDEATRTLRQGVVDHADEVRRVLMGLGHRASRDVGLLRVRRERPIGDAPRAVHAEPARRVVVEVPRAPRVPVLR